MTNVVETLRRADEHLRRIGATAEVRVATVRRTRRALSRAGRRLRRALLAAMTLLLAFGAYGLFVGPIGIGGVLLAATLVPLVALTVLIWPARREKPLSQMARDPAKLAAATDDWLHRHRRGLPLAADRAVEAISSRLAALEEQLKLVDARAPVAQDLGRLLSTHLPSLVENYERIPAADRAANKALDHQLVDGLQHVEAALARVSQELAQGQRDAFLTQRRFLETRYGTDRGEPTA